MIYINEQRNQNECGICVIKSLIKHFHNKEIDKIELLSQIAISKMGMNLYDFEFLLRKYNIKANSYEIEFQEFKEKEIREVFVLLINNKSGLHYVICKKNKNGLKIYDSELGKYYLTYDQLKDQFQNIIIFCNKDNKIFKSDFKLNKIINFIDWRSIIIANTINLLIISLSIFGGTYLNQIIQNVISNKSLNNLISINIIFLTSFICLNLNSFFLNHFSLKNKINYFNIINYQCINNLIYKKNDYFYSIELNNLINLREHIDLISNFYAYSINRIFCDILAIGLTTIILSILNIWFLLIIIIMILIIVFINYISHLINKKYITKCYSHQNEYIKESLDLINLVKDNKNIDKSLNLKNKIFNIAFKIQNLDYKYDYKKLLINFFNSSIQSCIFLLLVLFNILTIINEKSTIGIMFFSISLFQMNISSFKNIFSFYLDYPNIKYSYDVISNIININTDYSTNVGIYLSNLSNIKIGDYFIENNTLIVGKNGSGKSTILKSLAKLVISKEKILLNGINHLMISDKWFNDNILYFSNSYNINEEEIIQLIQSEHQEIILKIIKETNISSLNDIEKLSTGEKQILSFLSLLMYKNKVLLVDELLSNVNEEFKKNMLNNIKPIIAKNNFIIMVDHNINNYKFFDNIVEVNNAK